MKLKKNNFRLTSGIFCLCLAVTAVGFGQSEQKPVIISGVLSDDFKSEENVIVEFNCYNEISFGKTIAFQHYQMTVEDGKFDLTVLPTHDHFYLEVALYAQETDIIYNTYEKGMFLIRAGDTLDFSLGKTDIRFNSQTPARISRQSEILDVRYRFPAIPRDAYEDKPRLFRLRKAALDEIEKKKLGILQRSKHLFSEMEYSQISNDIISMKNRSLLNAMNSALYREPGLSAQLTDFFNAMFLPLPTDAQLSTLESVGYFPDFVYFRELVKARLSDPQGTPDDLIETIWDNLYRSYNGALRERVWIDVLLQLGNNVTYDVKEKLYQKSKVLIQGEVYRQALEIWASNHLTRSEIIDFSLETTEGTFLSPIDLRGKVVIMDFWFNGCYPCMMLAKNMEPIIARYIDDSNVLFVGVNVDKYKERWLSAVASGKYVSPGQINTYTNGLGKYHPLITHYNIIGFPKLMILDPEGRVYNKSIPVPLSAETSEEFIGLIESLKNR